MLGVVFVFAAAWCIELAIYFYSMKGARERVLGCV
jgi:hypothetical protein